MTSKHDIRNREDLVILVHEFYNRIGRDEALGAIFFEVIGNQWDEHLDKMVNFWESLLFSKPVYNGHPFSKHVDLPLTVKHFEQWLLLFFKTIDAYFIGDKANEVKSKATNIAKVFMAKMFDMNAIHR